MVYERFGHGCTIFKSPAYNGRPVAIAAGGAGIHKTDTAELWDYTTEGSFWQESKLFSVRKSSQPSLKITLGFFIRVHVKAPCRSILNAFCYTVGCLQFYTRCPFVRVWGLFQTLARFEHLTLFVGNHLRKWIRYPKCQIFFKSQTLTNGSFASLWTRMQSASFERSILFLKHAIWKKHCCTFKMTYVSSKHPYFASWNGFSGILGTLHCLHWVLCYCNCNRSKFNFFDKYLYLTWFILPFKWFLSIMCLLITC